MTIKQNLLQRLRTGAGGESFVQELSAALTGTITRTPEDAELLLGLTQQAWIADQRNPAASRARDAAQQLIELLPNLQDGYRALGLAHLSRREYREAFMAFTAAGRIGGAVNLDNFKALAQNLMLGTTQARFQFGAHSYVFDLSCHNAAAIEAGAFHSVGVLTELDELQALEHIAQGRTIASIVEVGVLMGNHTAFFLKAFKPARLTLADADPANMPFIESTVRNNAVTVPQLNMVNAFVGRGGGETVFAGQRVPHKSLAEIVTSPIDLLKIDVDGAELALLESADSVVTLGRPLVMIETTPETHRPALEWFAARSYDALQSFDHGDYINTFFRSRS